MLPIQRERERRLRFQAQQLADTGRYLGWRNVEEALIAKGRRLVAEALGGRLTRFLIDARCAYARRRNANVNAHGD